MDKINFNKQFAISFFSLSSLLYLNHAVIANARSILIEVVCANEENIYTNLSMMFKWIGTGFSNALKSETKYRFLTILKKMLIAFESRKTTSNMNNKKIT